MTTTWFTSDNHFHHPKIIELSKRPFDNIDQMENAMVDNWNSVVGKDDKVFVLGDFSMGKVQDTLDNIAPLLNGNKVLIAGNHDRMFLKDGSRNKDHLKWTRAYEAAGFTVLSQRGPHAIKINGKHVQMSHFPYKGDHTADTRYKDDRPKDKGRWLLHGHVHEHWRQHGRQINVGVDVWDFTPVHIDTLAEMIDAGPTKIMP